MAQGKLQLVPPMLPLLMAAAGLAGLALLGLYMLDRMAGATVAVLASLV